MSRDELSDGPLGSRPAPAPERIARGAFWATLEVWGVVLLQPLVFALLARFVGPEAFGLVAIAMAFVLVPQGLLVQGGWIEALVQRPDLAREHVDSVFWLLAGLGLASALLLLGLAPFVAAWFARAELEGLLAVLAIGPLLSSLMVVPAGLLQRRLRFAPLALRSIGAVAVGGTIAVALAVGGAGPWALVAAEIAWPLGGVLVLGATAGYRPRASFSHRHLLEIGRFALGLTGERLLALAELFLLRSLLAAAAGPTAVGIFALAHKMFDLSVELVTRPALRVALPGLAAVRADPGRLQAGLSTAVEITGLLAVAGYALALAEGPELLALAFGTAWREAGVALQPLAAIGPLVPFGLLLVSGLQAAGRSDLVFLQAAVGTGLLLALLVPLLGWGAVGAAAALALRGLLLLPLRLVLARRALAIPLRPLVAPLGPLVLAGLAMLASMLAVRPLLADPAAGSRVALAAGIGGLVYALALLLVARPTLRRVATALGRLRTGPASGEALNGGRSRRPSRRACGRGARGEEPTPPDSGSPAPASGGAPPGA